MASCHEWSFRGRHDKIDLLAPEARAPCVPEPGLLSPPGAGLPRATHGARSQQVRPRCSSEAARPARAIGASRLPAVKRGTDGRGSIASSAMLYSRRGLEQHDETMLATRLLFDYPGTSYSRWSPRFVLWPPGELPVSQSAGHPYAGASCSRYGCGVMLATSGPVSRALGGVARSPAPLAWAESPVT